MTTLPPHIEYIAQHGLIDVALRWADTVGERLLVADAADDEQLLWSIGSEALYDQGITSIRVEGDTVEVTAGPFYGTHAIRRDPDGTVTPSLTGTYLHEPTDIEFDADCPNQDRLCESVRQATTSEGPEEAARHAYRKSRL